MSLGVALVTGAAQGIGRAIALRLARDGFNVALNDVGHQDQLASLQIEIQALGRDSIQCIADVSDEAEVKNMIGQTVERLGGLDVVRKSLGAGTITYRTEFISDGGQRRNIYHQAFHRMYRCLIG
jgi:NAD(P)-dependent dehydrogenase (short-subunit alcohol dehydrogenase family)